MPFRLIEVTASSAHLDTVTAIAETNEVSFYRVGPELEGRVTVAMLAGPGERQAILDSLQTGLAVSDDWRVLVLPLEAVIPTPPEPAEDRTRRRGPRPSESREELYNDTERGAHCDVNFLLLVFLSTLVAAIGLTADNVAVVIGAMVIAPLLGPNLALILAAALGDRGLLWRAVKTNLIGVSLALVISIVIGALLPVDLQSKELLDRTSVGAEGMMLALASGAAAALCMTSGLSTTLVGVMVAVALLPPTATLGIMLGAGQPALAWGAALLLAVNVVSVNLAGQIVFLLRGGEAAHLAGEAPGPAIGRHQHRRLGLRPLDPDRHPDTALVGELDRFHIGNHPRPQRLVGQRPFEGAHVLGHVVDPRGRRNGTGDGRVRDDELQEYLRPVLAGDLRRPAGQRPPGHQVEERAAAKGPVGDHRQAALGGVGQEPCLGLAVQDVVGELDDVQRLCRHHRLEVLVAAPVRGGDTDVPHPPLGLPLHQRLVVHLPVQEIMDLHEVEGLDAPKLFRLGHLADAERLKGGPDLGGGKETLLVLDAGEAAADHRLGSTVHGRGIHKTSTHVEEALENRLTRGQDRRVVADIEGDPRTHADHRQSLAAAGDGFGERPGGGRLQAVGHQR